MPTPSRLISPDDLVQAVRASGKYRALHEPLIRRIALHALAIRKTPKEAIKTVKSMLHQIAGVYPEKNPPYETWSAGLESIHQNPALLESVCLSILNSHASARERLDDMAVMYQTIFREIGDLDALLDIGCGLNPLALPWMPIPRTTRYYACDIWMDQIAFINRFFHIVQQNGHAFLCDAATHPPDMPVDAALLMKLLPLLEHLPQADPLRLLRSLNAPWLVVSYPVASLGGRKIGMTEHYTRRFQEMMRMESWKITRRVFPSELVFIIDRRQDAAYAP